MFENDFIDGSSVIHRLDPRFKIILAAVFSIIIAASSRWAALIPGLFFAALLVLVARLSFKKLLIRLTLVNGLILLLWFFLPFSLEGTPLFSIGPLTATREGVLYVTRLTLRSNIIVLSLISLISTTSIFALGHAMKQLRIHDKIIQLFLFTFRYIHVIHVEYQRLHNALKIRGFRPKTDMHSYRTYAYLVGMLLVRSYDRAERIKKAMYCRGFKGQFYSLSKFSLKPGDFFITSLMLLATGIIALLQWTRTIY